MRSERENELLDVLLMSPSYLKLDESLSSNLFSSPERRRVFCGISEIYEDYQPETIDIGLLAERTGLSVQFIAGLIDGCYRPDPKNFVVKIREVQKSRLTAELMELFRSGKPNSRGGRVSFSEKPIISVRASARTGLTRSQANMLKRPPGF